MNHLTKFLEMRRMLAFLAGALQIIVADPKATTPIIEEARKLVEDGSITDPEQFLHYLRTRKLVVWEEFPND